MEKIKIFLIAIILLCISGYFISYSMFKSVDKVDDNYIEIGKINAPDFDQQKCLIFRYDEGSRYDGKAKEDWLANVGFDKINTILKNSETKFPNVINISKSKVEPVTSRILLLVNSESLFFKNKNLINMNDSYIEIRINKIRTKIPLTYRKFRTAPFTYRENELKNVYFLSGCDSILIDLRSYPNIGTFIGKCQFKVYVNKVLYDEFNINFVR